MLDLQDGAGTLNIVGESFLSGEHISSGVIKTLSGVLAMSVDMVKVLETVMLLCFGAAWPASILKSWKSRTTKGKSLFFLLVILTGYAAGVSKVLISEGAGGFLLLPYGLNMLMVAADALIYMRNAAIDRRTAQLPQA